jgi:hypothetical protein
MFLRNVGSLSPGYMTLYTRRQHSFYPDVLRGFLEFLRANAQVASGMVNDRFLLYPFQLVTWHVVRDERASRLSIRVSCIFCEY